MGVAHFITHPEVVIDPSVPVPIVTDKLQSYGVARRKLLPKAEHRQSRYLNNRAENSHRPTRRRERQLQRFKSPEQANDFLSAHAFIYGHFHLLRHLLAASAYRALRTEAFMFGSRTPLSETSMMLSKIVADFRLPG